MALEIRVYWAIINAGFGCCTLFFTKSLFLGITVAVLSAIFLEPFVEGDDQ